MVDTSILPADALESFECPRHDCEMDRMRIAELEERLIACEKALLMAAAGSMPDTAEYMQRYPVPYKVQGKRDALNAKYAGRERGDDYGELQPRTGENDSE